jgi:hypothetical protein
MGKAKNPVVGVGEWLIAMLIMAVPLLNVVAVLYWAFAGGVPTSKANLARAVIIWCLITTAFSILVFVVLGFSFAAFAGGAATVISEAADAAAEQAAQEPAPGR